jgi:formamidopyrimidine-DNA glycosylase
MPELPEVKTTRLGGTPHVVGRKITEMIIRHYDLRQPVSPELAGLEGARFVAVGRRSKCLLLETDRGVVVLVHLGMSGSLRVIPAGEDWKSTITLA